LYTKENGLKRKNGRRTKTKQYETIQISLHRQGGSVPSWNCLKIKAIRIESPERKVLPLICAAEIVVDETS